METQFTKLPDGTVNILLTDSGRLLEISSDSPQVSFFPIKLDNRSACDFLLRSLREKKWILSESKTVSNATQMKATIPGIYLLFIESVANCDLHSDGNLTAYDALKLWHAKGLMDKNELEDIMTMFE
jgi:hypothetical protein